MTDRFGDTYNGFSGGQPPQDEGLRLQRPDPPAPPPPPKRGVSKAMLAGGVAAAAALGILFGVVAKPDLDKGARREPMQAVTAESSATPVPVEVAAVTPQPLPRSAGKLEVLPPDLARAADARAAATTAPRPTPVIDTAPRDISPPRVTIATPPEPSFNCRYAGSRAERMICGDPQLARLDRRLDQAFDRAVAQGGSYRELRAEQDDWLSIREDAARRSPDAVESVYRQRIAELEDF